MNKLKSFNENINNLVGGALRDTINAHGPITKQLIPSATKRVSGQIDGYIDEELKRKMQSNYTDGKYIIISKERYDEMRMGLQKKNRSIMDLVSKLKSFESFSMYRENCDRCGESTNNSTTMSVFNEDVICMSCKAKEKEDPDYDAAVEAEMAALKRGDSNYKGAIPNYKPIKR